MATFRLYERLLARTAPTWRELLLASGVLGLVGGLVYGRHVLNGGLYSDDWAFASVTEHGESLGSEYRELRGAVGFRPLGVLSIIARFELLGGHTRWHLALVLALTVLLCAAAYLLLRMLGFQPLHAGAIALLVLVCPYADATRLWATGSGANIAIVLWLLGVVVALRGLRATSRNRTLALHAAAVALYLASLLQYEVAYAAICGSGLLYFTRGGWRQVLPRWAADVAVASAAVAVIVSRSTVSRTESMLDHARLMFDGGAEILADIVWPFGNPHAGTVAALLALAFAVGAVVALREPRDSPLRGDLLRWLTTCAGGLLLAVAGYSLFAGAFDYYHPLAPGLANRTNAVASLGFIATAYAALATVATILFQARRVRLLAAAAPVAAALVLFVGYADRLRDSIGVWDRAWNSEVAVLNVLQSRFKHPPHGATFYTFGHPVVSENPGLPVFISFWELRGAVQALLNDPTISAFPALPGTRVTCTPTGARLEGAGYPPEFGDVYGELYLVDVPRQRVERVDSRRECTALSPQFLPGPLQATPPT